MSEHQVLSDVCAASGGSLMVSTSNGYSVHLRDAYIGFIHASVGDRWNAYLRQVEMHSRYLGKFSQVEAVDRIVQAFIADTLEKAGP
ncbi:hypothetical protein [Paractinoplanes hotanensis]|uniref:Uncharacterized protein n=1 Tax=Paractinoplanes hotanensis TaxID=2906497 RepID=A0ABT0Y866_9ACTN|nr:hypothetical protein [Actinoplanes hotanensis]MCM4082228.1 hypothetical protein [Actinoplanes hotanensis]